MTTGSPSFPLVLCHLYVALVNTKIFIKHREFPELETAQIAGTQRCELCLVSDGIGAADTERDGGDSGFRTNVSPVLYSKLEIKEKKIDLGKICSLYSHLVLRVVLDK